MIAKPVCLTLPELGQQLANEGIYINYNSLWKMTATGRLQTKRVLGRVAVVGTWPAIVNTIRTHGPKPRNLSSSTPTND